VEEMATARWRQQRAWTLESTTIDKHAGRVTPEIMSTYGEQATEPLIIASAVEDLADNSNVLALLMRYEAPCRASLTAASSAFTNSRIAACAVCKTNPVPQTNTAMLLPNRNRANQLLPNHRWKPSPAAPIRSQSPSHHPGRPAFMDLLYRQLILPNPNRQTVFLAPLDGMEVHERSLKVPGVLERYRRAPG